jgi:hypothetical protein
MPELSRAAKRFGSRSRHHISKPRWVDYPATFFFIVKTLLLLGSFLALGTEFYYRIFLAAHDGC